MTSPVARPAWLDRARAEIEATDEGYFAQFAPPPEGGQRSSVLILVGPHEDGGEASRRARGAVRGAARAAKPRA